MLRSLPERLYANLAGQHAWLAKSSSGEILPTPASLPAYGTPVELLDVLLHSLPTRRGIRKLSVMLPSQSARCVSLPWSPNLRGRDEYQAYAVAHLEQAGLSGGDNHAVHAEFRHYGAQGLAYAVPMPLLNDLHAVATRHGAELTTVLPIGAVAHLAASRSRGNGLEVSLVAEESSIIALVLNRTGLHRYDAEPTIGGQLAAMRRLLARLAADGGEFARISICTDRDGDELAGVATVYSSQAPVCKVKSCEWRRFL